MRRRPAEVISPSLRKRFFYSVEAAGALIGMRRTQSYEAVRRKEIPAQRHGKLWLVPRKQWDREVRRLLKRDAGPNCPLEQEVTA
jgi:hypothetical protein